MANSTSLLSSSESVVAPPSPVPSNPGPQWRDSIVVERAVFIFDGDGISEFDYVLVGYMPREQFGSWLAFMGAVKSFVGGVITNFWSTELMLLEVNLFGWREPPSVVTPEGRVLSYFDWVIDFDPYLPFISVVKLLIVPNIMIGAPTDLHWAVFQLDPVVPLPPSPPLRPTSYDSLGNRRVWCPKCRNFCRALSQCCRRPSSQSYFLHPSTVCVLPLKLNSIGNT